MSQSHAMGVVYSSDRSLLLIFADEISLEAHHIVLRLMPLLRKIPAVVNVHPAYASILIDFDPLEIGHGDLEHAATELYTQTAAAPPPAPRIVEIPVCYGGAHGPDLNDVAAMSGRTPAEVVEIHASAGYLVCFLGFSPGFPYLSGMPASIAASRLATPRSRVPAGSVAIGGRQTGVYPLASPGGWRLIGRTPLHLFQPSADPPALLGMGDHVKFVPISKDDF